MPIDTSTATTATNEHLGNLLVRANRLTAKQLAAALAAGEGDVPLAALLAEAANIHPDTARDVLNAQMRYAEGRLLVGEGLIAEQALEDGLMATSDLAESLTATLIRRKVLRPDVVPHLIERLVQKDWTELKRSDVDPAFLEFIPKHLADRYQVIPLARLHDRLLVATTQANNINALDDLRVVTGFRVVPIGIPEVTYRKFFEPSFDPSSLSLPDLPVDSDAPEATVVQDAVEDLAAGDANAAPVIVMVNKVLGNAVVQRVSDIHIEAKEKFVLVRYRKEGLLEDALKIPASMKAAMAARIKIMANLDVSERRLPQDGKVRARIGSSLVDLRVSTMPSQYGEKIVLRILNKDAGIRTLDEMGFLPNQMEAFQKILSTPQGIFFVTGPTGSGKTSSLYSALAHIQTPSKNIITIEDPIEYNMDTATQVQVQANYDLTFARVLRAVLRQDPDIVLIGETRDHETAKIAIEAALTGHMVLTSLHTNDATASISRLVEMGIEPYMIGSAMLGAIAQRLVRKLCVECREPYKPSPEIAHDLGLGDEDQLWRAKGCPTCNNSGSKGRRAVYEVFVMDEECRDIIVKNGPPTALRAAAQKNGMTPIRNHAIQLMKEGVISFEEFVRVIYSDNENKETTCPRCKNAVEAEFATCPFCKFVINPACSSCNTPVKSEWVSCPKCGDQLSKSRNICPSCMGEMDPNWVRCPFCYFE